VCPASEYRTKCGFAIETGGTIQRVFNMQGIILAVEIVAIYVIFGPVVLFAIYIIFDKLANRTPELSPVKNQGDEWEDDPALWTQEHVDMYLKKRKLSSTGS